MNLASYKSPKTEVRKSVISGRGLFAKKVIRRGEIVTIKTGHIVNASQFKKYRTIIRDAELQIADDFFLVPLKKEEFGTVMCFVNHSCEPNIGVKGSIIWLATRDIKAGEELTADYATFNNRSYYMNCECKAKVCRNIVTGRDWRLEKLQKKYKGFFSWYLEDQIERK
jgi:SET domain-containing protein